MSNLPVQSASPLATLASSSPTPGTKPADAANGANGSQEAFSGVLKREMTRQDKPAAKPHDDKSGNVAGKPESAPSTDPASESAIDGAAQNMLNPAAIQLLAALMPQTQATGDAAAVTVTETDAVNAAHEPVTTDTLLPVGTLGTEATTKLALTTGGITDPSAAPSPSAKEGKKVETATVAQLLAGQSRLPEQASVVAKDSHGTGAEAANPAGRSLPSQAIDMTEQAVRHETKPQAAPDFAALVERATTELGTQAATAQATVARGEAPASYRIEAPAGQQNRWAQEIGDRVAWMVTSREQRAELVLNPPQLGRIEVTLSVNGDQANAWFSSPNSAVRELLETSLPRLREVMADAGIQLGQAQVGADNPGFAPKDGEQRRETGAGMRASTIDSGHLRLPSAAPFLSGGRGMVDIFA